MRKKMTVAFLCLLVLITSASAGKLGGKWETNPTYHIDSSNSYYSAVTNAAKAWNNVFTSDMEIKSTSVTSAYITINTNAYGQTGWNAQGEPGPDYTSGTYLYATMRINTTYMDSYTATKKLAICTHEFGHILGLAHNTYTSPRTLMYERGSGVYYDQWGISTPQTNDISDLNSIY